MGILNVTPDSFAERGRHGSVADAVDAALQLERDGADILDIGGESTRPGAEPVGAEVERSRVLPVIEALAGRLRIPISIDTYKADVAGPALAAGAAIVNDISGLRFDSTLGPVVAAAGAPIILMHTRGGPRSMHDRASFTNVVGEVMRELADSIGAATTAGVRRDRIVIDPGIGFAKRSEHSYGVLAHLAEVASALDRPLLVGPSRKSFMREALGERPAAERDWGTAAAVTAAVLAGAHIVRVHAVAQMVQVVRVAEAVRNAAETRL
ncbi:MAG TPA: dihydropteroate synthase [Vicinamibacterales bacterium]